jgi:ATP-dependent Clp endopeptidase proteolytic subunit ClpP
VALCFAAARSDDELTIDIFDVIGFDFWGDGISARSIQRSLTAHADAKRILVRINSPGGEVFEGQAIFNLLRHAKAEVRVQIIGLAASMASIVALAGSHVEMAENALYMIHDPWVFAIGSADEMRKTASLLDKIKETALNVYEGASNLGRAELAELMSAETWMTAQEALDAGFVDAILPVADEPKSDTDTKARVAAVLGKFEHLPAAMRLARPHEPQIAAMAQPKPKEQEMNLAAVIAMLGLPDDTTEEQALAAIAALKKPETSKAATPSLADAVPRADYDAVRAKMEALEAKQRADAKAAFEARVDGAIDAACKAGKVTPASRDYHRASCLARGEKGLEEFVAYVDAQPEIAGNAQMDRAEKDHGGAVKGATSESERELCKSLGITPEQMAATRKEMAEDPKTYPPEVYRHALSGV